jgi:hypothetical protein
VTVRPAGRDAMPVLLAGAACLAFAVLQLLGVRVRRGEDRKAARRRRRPWVWAGVTADGQVRVGREPSTRRRLSLPTSIGASGSTSWIAAAGFGERPALEPGGPLPR